MQHIEHSDKTLGEIDIRNKKLVWLSGKPYYVFEGNDCDLFKTITSLSNFPDKIFVSTNEFSGGKLIDDILMVNNQHKLCEIVIGEFLISGQSNFITQFNLKCKKIQAVSIGQIGKIKLKQCSWYNEWLFPYPTQYIYIYKIMK